MARMNLKRALFLEVAVILLCCLNIQGKEMVLRTNSDCGHTVYIDKNNDLHIEYLDGVVGDCDITVICRGEEGSRYPRLCVQAELLHVGECLIRVDMHHLTVIEGYENKTLIGRICSSDTSKETCTYEDKLVIVFKKVSDVKHGPIDIKLKVSPKLSDSPEDTVLPAWAIALCVIGSVLITVCILLVILHRVFRQRARLARPCEYGPQYIQSELSPYHRLQYQSSTEQIAGYPTSLSGEPASQSEPDHEYQANGYQESVHSGVDLTIQTTCPNNSPVNQGTGTVPTEMLPPSYQQSAEMEENSETQVSVTDIN